MCTLILLQSLIWRHKALAFITCLNEVCSSTCDGLVLLFCYRFFTSHLRQNTFGCWVIHLDCHYFFAWLINDFHHIFVTYLCISCFYHSDQDHRKRQRVDGESDYSGSLRVSDGTERQSRERKPSSTEFQGVHDDQVYSLFNLWYY